MNMVTENIPRKTVTSSEKTEVPMMLCRCKAPSAMFQRFLPVLVSQDPGSVKFPNGSQKFSPSCTIYGTLQVHLELPVLFTSVENALFI